MWFIINVYLVLVPIPGTELSNPCEFLSDMSARSIFCSRWAPGWFLDRAGHQKDQAMIRSLKFSVPHPQSPERGEGLKMDLIVDHTYVRKPPSNPRSTGFGGLLGWWTLRGAGRVAYPKRAWKLRAPSHIPGLSTSSIWMFTCIPYHILL